VRGVREPKGAMERCLDTRSWISCVFYRNKMAVGVIMDVFIINMPARHDRRASMRELMARLGIERYSFVEPVIVDDDDIPLEYRANGMTSGYMSLNLTVRDKIFGMARTDVFLVFEDDIIETIPVGAILPRIRAILREAPPDWDLVYLEYCMERCSGQREGEWLRKGTAPHCTAALLYNRRSVGNLRQCMDTRKRLIDFAYVDCIKAQELRAYIAWPPLFAQDVFYGAGDLAHMSPSKVQWWLNLILKMYPGEDEIAVHAPRLPHCLNARQLAPYVRWDRVAAAVSVLVAIAANARYYYYVR
jgi:hypothetical protein